MTPASIASSAHVAIAIGGRTTPGDGAGVTPRLRRVLRAWRESERRKKRRYHYAIVRLDAHGNLCAPSGLVTGTIDKAGAFTLPPDYLVVSLPVKHPGKVKRRIVRAKRVDVGRYFDPA